MRIAFYVVLIIAFASQGFASSWDEPWHEDVLRNSELVAKVVVAKASDDINELKVLKVVAGAGVSAGDEIKLLSTYYMLDLHSLSYPVTNDFLEEDDEYYLILKSSSRKEAEWMLSTPTSGDAQIEDAMAIATFRHSTAKALVDTGIYEKATSAIFNFLHNQAYDTLWINDFLSVHLNKKPVRIPKNTDTKRGKQEFDSFCNQHVALELFHYFGTEDNFKSAKKFLKLKQTHVQISAIRALSRINSAESKNMLIGVLKGKYDDLIKVFAVKALDRLSATELVNELENIYLSASTEEVCLVCDIMDDRIATKFPKSVKDALRELLSRWGKE